MDLALEMGVPADELASRMTEDEFQQWHLYAARRLLPHRRIEFALAKLTMLVDMAGLGAKDKVLADYLFGHDVEDDVDDAPVDNAKAAAEFFDFKPRARRTTE